MFEIIPSNSDALIEALTTEQMPTADLNKLNRAFWRLRSTDEVVGFIGLEQYGEAALLRSLAVLPEFKGQGFGAQLVARVTQEAAARKISTLWLLTKTAQPFFEHLGWQVRHRADAPPDVSQSDEFTGLCPASAICMSFTVTEAASTHQ